MAPNTEIYLSWNYALHYKNVPSGFSVSNILSYKIGYEQKSQL